MERKYENKFVMVDFDRANSILIVEWKPETKDMTGDEFQKEGGRIIQMALGEKVMCVIGNNTNFYFAVSPEIQEAMNRNTLLKVNNSSIKKFAHVVSSEMISQMSIEQLFEENEGKTFEDKYFDNLKQAIEWCSK